MKVGLNLSYKVNNFSFKSRNVSNHKTQSKKVDTFDKAKNADAEYVAGIQLISSLTDLSECLETFATSENIKLALRKSKQVFQSAVDIKNRAQTSFANLSESAKRDCENIYDNTYVCNFDYKSNIGVPNGTFIVKDGAVEKVTISSLGYCELYEFDKDGSVKITKSNQNAAYNNSARNEVYVLSPNGKLKEYSLKISPMSIGNVMMTETTYKFDQQEKITQATSKKSKQERYATASSRTDELYFDKDFSLKKYSTLSLNYVEPLKRRATHVEFVGNGEDMNVSKITDVTTGRAYTDGKKVTIYEYKDGKVSHITQGDKKYKFQ